MTDEQIKMARKLLDDPIPGWVGFKEGISDDDYHADKTTVSSTGLKKIKLKSAKTFAWNYLNGTDKEPTPALKFGKLAHMAILEGPKFRDRYVVIPEFWGPTQDGKMSQQSKVAKDKKAAWLAEQPADAVLCTEDERDHLLGMIDSILSHEKASSFLSEGVAEISGYYVDPVTGIRCRIRLDFGSMHRGIITELKTTRDCRDNSFQWDIFGDKYNPLWYDFQLAMQSEGYKVITGQSPRLCAWLAIEKEPPYEVAVHVMTIPTAEVGHIKYRRALDTLAECLKKNQWPGVQEANEVSFIAPPDYQLAEYGVNYEREMI